jgi:hypothetical protein
MSWGILYPAVFKHFLPSLSLLYGAYKGGACSLFVLIFAGHIVKRIAAALLDAVRLPKQGPHHFGHRAA